MLSGNYQRHFKVLGKLCKIYDDAAADAVALGTLIDTLFDQVATGGSASRPGVKIVSGFFGRLENAINNGPVAAQEAAVACAKAYITGSDFRGDLTTTPESNSAADVIAALETDMGAGVDNVTLGTLTTSGLVRFLNAVKGSTGTWNTEADATADYRDAIYVVSAVV